MFNFFWNKTTSFWRWMTNLWTVIFFSVIIWDFITVNDLMHKDLILPVAAIYTGVLAIYSAEKEFKRWRDSHKERHPGEVYVILWTILMVTIITIKVYLEKSCVSETSCEVYHLPPEVVSSYVVVLGILALTKESKKNYGNKRKK